MALRALLLLACSLGPAASVVTRRSLMRGHSLPSFSSYVEAHGRDFMVGSTEYARRKEIYERRVAEIRRHNAEPNRRWTAGVNHLSDRTDAEFQQRLGWRHHHRSRSAAIGTSSMLEIGRKQSRHDDDIDYRTNLSVAGDVPNQGGCGSCWAVASTQTLKRHHKLHRGSDRLFSTQELVSCVRNTNNCGGHGGCDGATVELAFEYVMNNGLRTPVEVPYEGKTGVCDKSIIPSQLGGFDDDKRQLFTTVGPSISQAFGLTGYHTIEKNKYEPLLNILFDKGPVAITVAAEDWSSYESGVFSCKDYTLDHAVVLMGIGKDGSDMTYIVQNSWGAEWGENGYIRLLRTSDEEANCKDDHRPKDGVACGPEEEMPSKVRACGTCGILYDNVYPTFTEQAR